MFTVYINYIFCISHNNYHNIDLFSTSHLVFFEAALVTPRAVRRVCVCVEGREKEHTDYTNEFSSLCRLSCFIKLDLHLKYLTSMIIR